MSNNAQGFWGINDLANDTIVKINGVALATPMTAADYCALDSSYTIVKDADSNDVLILTSTTATTLTMAASGVDYQVIGDPIEYIGGHPPTRPK